MAEKTEKKDIITRIRRGKKQIILDKVSTIYKNVPEDVLEDNVIKIGKILDVLEAAMMQAKKTRRMNFDKLAKGKSREEMLYMIEQLQKRVPSK